MEQLDDIIDITWALKNKNELTTRRAVFLSLLKFQDMLRTRQYTHACSHECPLCIQCATLCSEKGPRYINCKFCPLFIAKEGCDDYGVFIGDSSTFSHYRLWRIALDAVDESETRNQLQWFVTFFTKWLEKDALIAKFFVFANTLTTPQVNKINRLNS